MVLGLQRRSQFLGREELRQQRLRLAGVVQARILEEKIGNPDAGRKAG